MFRRPSFSLRPLVKRFAAAVLSTGVAAILTSTALQAQPQSVIDIWNENLTTPASRYGDAPQGGTLRMGAEGTFDSFNPFSPRGMPAGLVGLTFETLGESDEEHDFVMRGLLAESFDIAPDRRSMTVVLRKEARFADGRPVTADDLVWTFNTLMTDASPVHRNYYREVEGVEKTGERSVKFTFKTGDNRELPIIVAQLPVLPSHWWKTRNLGDPQKDPMPGSGPYQYAERRMGQQVTLKRNPDWWGRALPSSRGLYNFETITVDYFRDTTVMREAFFAGNIDFFNEYTIKDWMLAYDVPPVKDGRILKAEAGFKDVFGISGVFMNTRRPFLSDRRVREALAIMFDFPRVNKTIFFDAYERTESFWSGTDEFQASAVMTPEERAALESLPDLDASAYEKLPVVNRYTHPKRSRAVMREALRLLHDAGWNMVEGVMKNAKGEALELTFKLSSPSMARIFGGWVADLRRIGIAVKLQPVDQTQYIDSLRHFDYDMVLMTIAQSSNPGNEQAYFWGSRAADQNGTRNYAGVRSTAVDELIARISRPENKADLTANVKVLDRILRNEWIVIPGWTSQVTRIAWWPSRMTPPDGKIPEGRRINIFSWHAPEGENP